MPALAQWSSFSEFVRIGWYTAFSASSQVRTIVTPGLPAEMRTWLRRAVPYNLVQTVRRIAYFGVAHQCYVCGSRLRTLLPQGYGYPVLEQLQVVGGMRKELDRCPVCHASDRDRLLKFFLDRKFFDRKEHASRSGDELRVLHVAPEKSLSLYLRARQDLAYDVGDLIPDRYYHLRGVLKLDLTSLPFDDGAYELIVANHVLEHIPDDQRAMAEINRVLAPGGVALLQVPFSLKLPKTIEGLGHETESTRICRYGQADHVRLYTMADYMQRLTQAGLAVELFWAYDHDPGAAAQLRLNPLEPVFVCSADPAVARQLCETRPSATQRSGTLQQ